MLILKKLTKKELLQFDASDTYDLEKLRLVHPRQIDSDSNGFPQYDDFFYLTDLGKRYYIFKKRLTNSKRLDWLRYGITTVIAVAALVISLLK
jgi:hypothetical protein